MTEPEGKRDDEPWVDPGDKFAPRSQGADLSFWRMAGIGLLLAGLAGLGNWFLSQPIADAFEREWIAANGFGGTTMMTLAMALSTVIIYPALQAILMVLVMPVVLSFRPAEPGEQSFWGLVWLIPAVATAVTWTLLDYSIRFSWSPILWSALATLVFWFGIRSGMVDKT